MSLQSLQQLLQTTFVHQNALTPGQVSYACDVVKRLYESCHWRKLDMFLIPAIRSATSDATALLQDLDELGRAAADAVGVLAIKLGATAVDTASKQSGPVLLRDRSLLQRHAAPPGAGGAEIVPGGTFGHLRGSLVLDRQPNAGPRRLCPGVAPGPQPGSGGRRTLRTGALKQRVAANLVH
ncbi:hypothetical protein LP419_34185 [Massilia sp. H-1]|nr:hypothetical protein LP419_34185 [Massilia sp. H-1]